MRLPKIRLTEPPRVFRRLLSLCQASGQLVPQNVPRIHDLWITKEFQNSVPRNCRGRLTVVFYELYDSHIYSQILNIWIYIQLKQYFRFKDQCPPEAKVRGSNPLGRAIYVNLINILKIPVVQVLGKIVGKTNSQKLVAVLPLNERAPDIRRRQIVRMCDCLSTRWAIDFWWESLGEPAQNVAITRSRERSGSSGRSRSLSFGALPLNATATGQ